MGRLTWCAAASVLALSAGPALVGAADAHAQAQGPRELEEVVVTARRSEEAAQSVPLTVTAITDTVLEANVIQSGLDLQKMVPTLSVVHGTQATAASYSLRGIRSGVVTYLNEAPASGQAVNLQLYDLGSVQAISGPQGTLFGRNSTGGAILFVPKQPTRDFEGFAEGEIGNYNRRQLTGAVNLPVTDRLQLRLSTQITRRDGVVRNLIGSDNQDIVREAYRLGVLFTPFEKLTNYTLVDYGVVRGHAFGHLTFNYPGTACPQALAACVYGAELPRQLQERQNQLGKRAFASSFPDTLDAQDWGVQNILTYALTDAYSVKYISSYRRSRFFQLHNQTSFDIRFVYGQAKNASHEWVNELQFSGLNFDDRFKWVVGAFTRHSITNQLNALQLLQPVGAPPFSIANSQASPGHGDNTSVAFYGQASLKLTDQLTLTGGLRQTRDDQSTISTSLLPGLRCALSPTIPTVNLATCENKQSGVFEATTYLASLDYKLTPGVLLYGTVSTGYNAGGFNQGIADSTLVNNDPETLVNYEAGVKADWRLGDIPLRTNVSVYYDKYKDIQRGVNRFVNNVAISGVFNAAEATLYGVQAEFLVRPASFLDLSGSVGYLHTRYDRFEATSIQSNATGNKFSQAPEWTYNLTATYHRDTAWGRFTSTLSYAFLDRVTFTDSNIDNPFSFQPAYGLWDFGAELKGVGGGGLDFGVWVKNLTDEEYAVNISDQSRSLGFVSYIYGDPRTFGALLRYRFGG